VKKPLIVHVFSSFEIGGAQARTCTLMNCFSDRYQFAILALDGDYTCASKLAANVSFSLLEPPASRGPWSVAALVRHIIQSVCPAAMFVYNWGAFDALWVNVPKRLIPTLYVEDGFGADEYAGPRARRRLIRRFLLPVATVGTIVPSYSLFELAVKEYALNQNCVHLIPNGISTERFSPRRDRSVRFSCAIPEDSIVFSFVGRLSREKNVAWMVDRFAEAGVHNSYLLLVGCGPEEDNIREAINRRQLASRVFLLGELVDTESLYRNSDIFLLSSVTEQMPISVLEAMSSGLPCLCTKVGDLERMLPAGRFGQVVDIHEPAEFVRMMRILARDSELRAEIGMKNREHVIKLYSERNMTGRWAELFEAVVTGRDVR